VDKARYLVEAHVLEGRSVGELAAAHGVHRSWIYKLLARYREGGLQALAPRSRRPRSRRRQTAPEVVQAIVALRAELQAKGHDAGAQTIAYHLALQHKDVPSCSSIWRILKREGLIVPEPHKRPRSALIRFCAELPNELWQADITAWQLASGEVVEILNLIDDHSRLHWAPTPTRGSKPRTSFQAFMAQLSCTACRPRCSQDNGAVFTGSYRHGKALLESELQRLGVHFKNSRPYHPQTCGKVERLHQTLKRYLARQPPVNTLSELQQQLDGFRHYYNHIRPHRALAGATPLQAFSARVKARPAGVVAGPHFRVREDRVDQTGKVSLTYGSKLYKIGVGRAHEGRAVRLLIVDQSIRVIDSDGELIRELTLDPSRSCQPIARC
jgi:transposase InsO family protein